MKKLFLLATVVAVAMVAKAEYLSWYVGETFTSGDRTLNNGTDYNVAALYWGTSQSSGTQIDAVGTAGGAVSYMAGGTGENIYYWIEVYNFSSSDQHYQSAAKTYAELSQMGVVLESFKALSNVTATWNGARAVATPEPTSGLLMLMGFAMLGLKRKKEV